MKAKSLLDPRNKMYLDLQIQHEKALHNKMRLNTAYSAKHLKLAIEYGGPTSSWRMILESAVDRKAFKCIEYYGKIYYYRGIPIIREVPVD